MPEERRRRSRRSRSRSRSRSPDRKKEKESDERPPKRASRFQPPDPEIANAIAIANAKAQVSKPIFHNAPAAKLLLSGFRVAISAVICACISSVVNAAISIADDDITS